MYTQFPHSQVNGPSGWEDSGVRECSLLPPERSACAGVQSQPPLTLETLSSHLNLHIGLLLCADQT